MHEKLDGNFSISMLGSKARLLASLLAGGVALALGVYFLEPKLLYFARKYTKREILVVEQYLHFHGLELQKLEIADEQYSYLIRSLSNRDSARENRLVVLLGGNAMTALDWASWIVEIRKYIEHAAFLCVDYPGYGDSAGLPTPSVIYENFNLSVLNAKSHINELNDIIVLGHSIGAAIAARWASTTSLPLSHIILSAPFTSTADMVPVLFPLVPAWVAKKLLWHNWNTRSVLAKIVLPRVFIVHGKLDGIVPFRMGQELSELAPQVVLVPIESAGHNDVLENYEIYGRLLSK